MRKSKVEREKENYFALAMTLLPLVHKGPCLQNSCIDALLDHVRKRAVQGRNFAILGRGRNRGRYCGFWWHLYCPVFPAFYPATFFSGRNLS